jgi:L-ascorbate metabolism protein UlaG (beta-lactamase superfamily)
LLPAGLAESAKPAPAWFKADLGTPVGADELAIRWQGTAAFEIRTARGSLLIDPHYSRHNLLQLLAGPIRPDMARIRKHVRPVQAVFVGHAHHDHLVDAPATAGLLQAPFYGSEDSARVARLEGLPETQIHTLRGGEKIRIGDMTVEAVPSKHSHIITNLMVNGNIAPWTQLPMRFWDYKHGQVFTYVIHWRGRTVYHFGSAEIVEETFRDRHADVALLCLSGWKDNPTVFKRIDAILHPEVVVPMHHDDFFRPLEEGFHPGQLAFVNEAFPTIRRDMPESHLAEPAIFQEYRLAAPEAP